LPTSISAISRHTLGCAFTPTYSERSFSLSLSLSHPLLRCRYRAQIANLARYEDTAPIKKIRFIEYYRLARDEGLTRHNILSGWKASGISPWNPRKVIRSLQVLESERTSHQPAPNTPPRPNKDQDLSRVLATPRNRLQLQSVIQSISSKESLSRPVRTLLTKATKGFDILHSHNAQHTLRIQAQARRITELANKKKKKVAIDCNKVFANIDTIKAEQERLQAAWNRRDRAGEARRTADAMLANHMSQFQHKFQIDLEIVE